MGLKQILSMAEKAFISQGDRLERLEEAVAAAKRRMGLYRELAVAGLALAGLFAVLWLQSRRQSQLKRQQ